MVIGPSVIRLYGVFFRHLWFFKDNYFGYDDKFCPLAVFRSTLPEGVSSKRSRRPEADVSYTCFLSSQILNMAL